MKDKGTNPHSQEIAEQLLAFERATQNASEASLATASRVFQKFGAPLGKLIGAEGYRAILTRGLTLARREAGGLNAIRVEDDGTLDGLDDETEKVSAVLVAHVVGLVLTFLGEPLTLKLMNDAWPERIDALTHSGERGQA